MCKPQPTYGQTCFSCDTNPRSDFVVDLFSQFLNAIALAKTPLQAKISLEGGKQLRQFLNVIPLAPEVYTLHRTLTN